jgi:alpha-tubulin suppressor-like RCC1 family protein
MKDRILLPTLLLLIVACDTGTGPDMVPDIDAPMQSRLSSDWVKTIIGEDGELYTWGPGFFGTLGLGDLAWRYTPQRIPSIHNVISYIEGGVGSAFALDANGDLYFWGNNSLYLQEPGKDTTVLVPTKVSHLENARSLNRGVAGASHFLTEDGRLGRFFHDPRTPTATLIPEEVLTTRRVLQVSETLGLYADGTLFTLYETEQASGGLVSGLSSVAAVQNIFFRRTVYLRLDGTVWAWGQNNCGQLGNGSFANSSTPVRVEHLSGVVQISAKYDFNLALKDDGTVWFWGFRGKTEDDVWVCQNVPVQVNGIVDAVDIHASFESLIKTKAGEYFVFNAGDYSLEQVLLP